MAKFKITGQTKLNGTIKIGGAKNAALKILQAAILADSPSTISNVPNILDINKSLAILESIGAKIKLTNNVVTIDPTEIKSSHPDEKLMKKLRGSIVLIGALLSKFGHAVFSQPGGCLIGSRPIDDHLDLFKQLGVKITSDDHTFYLGGKPQAGKIVLNKMSVTATENAILATVFSPGKTEIHIAAAEPEIADLANYLNKMGAKISGAGTHVITVEGVSSLSGTDYEVMPDRIEAGTYLAAAIATNSGLEIGPVISDHLSIYLKKMKDAGASFSIVNHNGAEYIKTSRHSGLTAQSIDTRPYPGFSTDLQSPYAVLMTQAKGLTNIFETMFEGRFAYLEQVRKMGASTEIVNTHEFTISGPCELTGAEVSGADIRGGAALVIAALIAKGETIITDIEFVDRGYENMDKKLRAVGADIERIS
ncbi:UDP-N-acetylglucosamine 1-carboxyvinyltransferase [Candidatus Berkelbacteria bacterium CG10_big_fil_rev_8_21_14_0_10_43_13]|uniref:UDP-N-acetylglucosamine 1-carboxyvinyltransferase n=1 Tax=Candidatus Berkelbacteria bacterium CG10_big_fil_rev_8_21_14_0_10_43_13 TaxID=1974514 RepID=A0A2H0W681_9BACT|nr:MAG: UDP-N-acetylglucosamine 1-carboxyvinyltransferase [Candidatus Berkelbacteria bacterium CG10_big_fil_rev_8_21_14_0_10_43_13]